MRTFCACGLKVETRSFQPALVWTKCLWSGLWGPDAKENAVPKWTRLLDKLITWNIHFDYFDLDGSTSSIVCYEPSTVPK
jgi:hypothetical protein